MRLYEMGVGKWASPVTAVLDEESGRGNVSNVRPLKAMLRYVSYRLQIRGRGSFTRALMEDQNG